MPRIFKYEDTTDSSKVTKDAKDPKEQISENFTNNDANQILNFLNYKAEDSIVFEDDFDKIGQNNLTPLYKFTAENKFISIIFPNEQIQIMGWSKSNYGSITDKIEINGFIFENNNRALAKITLTPNQDNSYKVTYEDLIGDELSQIKTNVTKNTSDITTNSLKIEQIISGGEVTTKLTIKENVDWVWKDGQLKPSLHSLLKSEEFYDIKFADQQGTSWHFYGEAFNVGVDDTQDIILKGTILRGENVILGTMKLIAENDSYKIDISYNYYDVKLLVENQDWSITGTNNTIPIYKLFDDDSYVAIQFADDSSIFGRVIINATDETQLFSIAGTYIDTNNQKINLAVIEITPNGDSYTKKITYASEVDDQQILELEAKYAQNQQ